MRFDLELLDFVDCEVDFDKFYQDSYNLMNMMIAFRNKLS